MVGTPRLARVPLTSNRAAAAAATGSLVRGRKAMKRITCISVSCLLVCLGSATLVTRPVGSRKSQNTEAFENSARRGLSSPSVVPKGVRAGGSHTRDQLSISRISLPLRFEANQGQTDPRAKFVARGNGYTMFLTTGEAVLSLKSAKPKPRFQGRKPGISDHGSLLLNRRGYPAGRALPSLLSERSLPLPASSHREFEPQHQAATPDVAPASVLSLRLVNANPKAEISGLRELPGRSNYFFGKDPKKWRTNVPNYAKVRYQHIYPGVDLVYYGNQRRLEHDFVVSPGADPSKIQLAIEGAQALRLDRDGNVVARVDSGDVVLRKPAVYQPGNRKSQIQNPKSVEGRFVLRAENRVGFEIGAYDGSRPVVIDPVLEYSTFLGGISDDAAEAIAVDSTGNAYVAGATNSLDFPTTLGAYRTSGNGFYDVFVAKLNPTGSALVYSTYLDSGSDVADVGGIAINSSGEAYLVGVAGADFPTTAGAFQQVAAGHWDVFVTKLNATGSALVYSTYVGGSGDEDPTSRSGIALDASGNAYVVGSTMSADFPTTPNAFDRTCGDDGNCDARSDAFVVKLNPSGTGLVFSTYLGGSDWENSSPGIAVDASSNVVVGGDTTSADFPTTAGAFDTTCGMVGGCSNGHADVYVTMLNSTGTALVFSTYLGGSAFDDCWGLALDASSNVFLTGMTFSSDFPTTSGAFDRSCGGCGDGTDAFVAKLNPTGTALVYSTFLGGSGIDISTGIAVDSRGNAYVTGASDDLQSFPITDLLQGPYDMWNADVFLTKVVSTGGAVDFSTYFGGELNDLPIGGIALDAVDNVYVAGYAEYDEYFRPFETTSGAFQTSSPGGLTDGFVVKVSTRVAGSDVILEPSSLHFGQHLVDTVSPTQTVTLTNVGDTVLTITEISASSEFTVELTTSCPAAGTLSPGGSCTIDVSFAPTEGWARGGSLTIKTDAPGSPHTVQLAGIGTDFALVPSPTSQTVNAGQSAAYTLNVNSVAGFNQVVSLACSGAPQRSNCQLSAGSVTPNGSNPTVIAVTVTTTARGMTSPPVGPPPFEPGGQRALPWLCLLLAALLASLALKSRRLAMTALATVVAAVVLWAACGGGGGGSSSQPGTPAGTYSLTLTGSVGGVSRQANVSLTVD
jgi:hypothetical protein